MKKIFKDIIDNIIAFRIGIALTVLTVIFFIGSTGYHLIDGMSFFDGFYMTFITITTIGFSELTNMSTAGRVFTIVIFVMGIGVISYIATQTTQLIFESEIFRVKAMKAQLKKMNNHYIVAGYGRIGHRIAQVLKKADIPLVIIEKSDRKIEDIKDDQLLYVSGDAQEEEVLREAGIDRAKGFICTLSRDQDNVFATLVARELNQDLLILVRTNQHKNTKKILRAGADKVISPYEIGADRMANVILRPHVDQFINHIQAGATDDDMQNHVFEEIRVGEGSELDGKSLSEAKIRQKYFVAIIAIITKDKDVIQFNPGSEDTISAGDSLIVLGDVKDIKKLRKEGCDDDRSISDRVSTYNFLDIINSQTTNNPDIV